MKPITPKVCFTGWYLEYLGADGEWHGFSAMAYASKKAAEAQLEHYRDESMRVVRRRYGFQGSKMILLDRRPVLDSQKPR